MGRYRGRRSVDGTRGRRGAGGGRARIALDLRRAKRQRAERRRLWTRLQLAHWAALSGICADRAGKARLARLISRMTGQDRGARESALAELELATLLIRAGFRVALLPESQARTADLECVLEDGRMFVEVTALVGSTRRLGRIVKREESGLDSHTRQREPHVLAARLLARVHQKARQLDHYAAPVVLAATVPHRDPSDTSRDHPFDQELDLKTLAGTLTLTLGKLRHLSAVLLSLWEVEPMPFQSGVRLANVHIVERSRQRAAYPRVRLLVLNPMAEHPLRADQVERLRATL